MVLITVFVRSDAYYAFFFKEWRFEIVYFGL